MFLSPFFSEDVFSASPSAFSKSKISRPEIQKSEIILNAVPKVPSVRNLEMEKEALITFTSGNGGAPKKEEELKIVHFILYGSTEKTRQLGASERSALIKDFEEIYGRLPKTDLDWQDLALIAEEHKPMNRVLGSEKKAVGVFKKVFNRFPDSRNDWHFVEWLAYRYRPMEGRDIEKEEKALEKFRGLKAFKKQAPASASDWAIVRALAYTELE